MDSGAKLNFPEDYTNEPLPANQRWEKVTVSSVKRPRFTSASAVAGIDGGYSCNDGNSPASSTNPAVQSCFVTDAKQL